MKKIGNPDICRSNSRKDKSILFAKFVWSIITSDSCVFVLSLRQLNDSVPKSKQIHEDETLTTDGDRIIGETRELNWKPIESTCIAKKFSTFRA